MNDLGKIKIKTDGVEVLFERIYPHNIKKVWDALTNPAKMAYWFTDVEWDFKPGGEITFIFQDEDKTKSYGKIVTIEPEKLFEFIWKSEEANIPDELARWELFDEAPEQTRLLFTYSRVSKDIAASVSTGWHMVLEDFEAYLNGKREFDAFGASSEPSEQGKVIKEQYQNSIEQN